MTPEQFCYWLHGYFEIQNPDFMTEKQVLEVKSHLDKVFNNPIVQWAMPDDYQIKIQPEWPNFGKISYTYWDSTLQEMVTKEDEFSLLEYNCFVPCSC